MRSGYSVGGGTSDTKEHHSFLYCSSAAVNAGTIETLLGL
jgi:hypothetical protein